MSFEDQIKGIRSKVKVNADEHLSKGTATQNASTQMNAIATGKAGTGKPSGQSNIGERMAQQSTLGQISDVGQQQSQQLDKMQIQAQQADAQQMGVESQRRGKELQVDTQRSTQIDEILFEFKQGNLDLNSEKGLFAKEMLANLLTRNNKADMQKIKEVAFKRDINDKAAHMKEGVALQIGHSKSEFYKQNNFITSEGRINREFNEGLAKQGLDFAQNLAMGAIADQREAAKMGALANVATSAVSYGTTPSSTTTTGGGGGGGGGDNLGQSKVIT